MTVNITTELILQIRDDAELTEMARVIEEAQRQAWWQGFGSDWDKARVSAYMLREAGFGRTGDTNTGSDEPPADSRKETTPVQPASSARAQAEDLPEDERHTTWCRGGHEGRCRRGRLTGTEKQ